MKKIVLVSMFAMILPLIAVAQTEDDLYYTPSKKSKTTGVENTRSESAKRSIQVSADNVVVNSSAPTAVVVRDSKGRVRNVDEYNRRYNSSDYNYSSDNDTLYIDEKSNVDRNANNGQWVSDFQGTEDDYEYANRIVRFRNPRYAIPISSPLYWDIVYGLGYNSWDWNVYYDDFYAYAFPTFTNRLWSDWRFGPSWGWGWNSWYGGYGGWYGSYYDGWYGGWYGGWYCGAPYHNYAWGGPGWNRGGWRGSSYQRFAGSRGYRGDMNQSRFGGRGGNMMSSRGTGMSGSRSRMSQGNNGRSEVTRMGGVGTRSMGRVVSSRDMGNSVRPDGYSRGGDRSTGINNVGRTTGSSRGTIGSGDNMSYSRGRTTYSNGSSNMYSRPSSTRSSVYQSEGRSMSRGEGSFRSSSESNRSYNSSRSSSPSYNSNNSSSRSFGGSSSGSFSGGGSSRGGGGSVGGGGSRGGGGGRR